MTIFNPIFSIHDLAGCERLIKPALSAVEALGVSAAPTRKAYEIAQGVAVVTLHGPMLRGIGETIAAWYGLTDTNILRAGINAAAADSSVNAIVIKINSPGGSVDGLFEAGKAVAAAVKQKPVIAAVDGMAASAAYYVAANASAIYASKMDLIGSIGTRMTIYDYSKAFELEGVEVHALATGEHKAAGEIGTKITDSQLSEFQRVVDGYFADFAGVVQGGRKMDAEQFAAVSDGRVFFAPDAQRLGLIDGIMSFDDVIKNLAETSDAKRRLSAI